MHGLTRQRHGSLWALEPSRWWRIILDALFVALVIGCIALLVNALRSDGIPLIAEKEYQILVPCPEPLGEVEALAHDAPEITDPGSLLIDAREAEAYAEWHLADAINVPFDYLEPVSKDRVAALIRSNARRIVVYGDGDDPDTGRELGRELSGRGATHVFFIEGGVTVLRGTVGTGGAP